MLRQEPSPEGKLRLQVAWQDTDGIDDILSAMPAWEQERQQVLGRVLQQCLETQYSAGVSVALSHGADPSQPEVDLRKLCFMLVDPEVSRYPTLFPYFAADAHGAAKDEGAGADADVDATPQPAGAAFAALLPKPRGARRVLSRNHLGRKRKSSSLTDHHPAHDYYLPEVWELLVGWVPGLDAYWLNKSLPKALDLYLWAVLLGNTSLAMGLLPACQEPLRAGLLGALLCSRMAAALPLDVVELQAAARKYEDFSESLLNACSHDDDSRKLLTTRSRHWPMTVIQLAVQAGLKSFCDNRYCQSLCDALYRGVASSSYIDEPETAMLPKWLGGGARGTLMLIFHALLPLPLPSPGFWLVDRRGAAATCHWYDYYRVPLVKQMLRMVLSTLYILLYSRIITTISDDVSEPRWTSTVDDQLDLDLEPQLVDGVVNRALRADGDGGGDGGGSGSGELLTGFHATMLPRPRQALLLLWTMSICLDEFYKWAVLPSTFTVDSWRLYNYFYLSTTLAGFTLRATISPELGHVVLCFNCVVGWLRVLQDLTLARGLGVLVIMIQSMISDIVLWFLVTLLFVGGFMVAFRALADPQASGYEVGIALLRSPATPLPPQPHHHPPPSPSPSPFIPPLTLTLTLTFTLSFSLTLTLTLALAPHRRRRRYRPCPVPHP